MPRKPPVRLAELNTEPREQIELPSGRVVDVRPIDGICMDLLSEMDADNTKGALVYDVVERCLPDVAREDVRALLPAEAAAVVVVAMGRVEVLRELAEKAEAGLEQVEAK